MLKDDGVAGASSTPCAGGVLSSSACQSAPNPALLPALPLTDDVLDHADDDDGGTPPHASTDDHGSTTAARAAAPRVHGRRRRDAAPRVHGRPRINHRGARGLSWLRGSSVFPTRSDDQAAQLVSPSHYLAISFTIRYS